MSYNHFPGLNSAHANGRFLRNDQTPAHLSSGDGRQVIPNSSSLFGLKKRRELVPLVGSLTIAGIADLPVSNTWDELDVSVYECISNQLDAVRTPIINRSIDPIAFRVEDEQSKKMKYGTKAALGLMMATYEVIPRLVSAREFENPNVEIGAIAMNANALFLDWMRLSKSTDGAVTYAMMKPKSKLSGFPSFFGMRFDTKWFEVVDDKPRVKTNKIPHMTMLWSVRDLSEPSVRIEIPGSVAAKDKTNHILFGCPASNFISKLHTAMVEKAIADGLFAYTYFADRKKYGYVAK